MNDQLEQELADSLTHRAEAAPPGAPLHLAAVRGRASQIQRRRRGVGAAVAVAALAIVVPSALTVGASLTRGGEAPVAPRPEQVVTPDHALAGNEEMTFTDLPLGPAPAIGYLDLSGERPVVVAGGSETILELEHIPMRYTELADGRFVVLTRDDEGYWFIEVTDTAGTTQQRYPNTGGFAVDATHSQVAWGDGGGNVQVLRSGAAEPRSLGTVPGFSSLTVTDLDGTDCFAMAGMDFGCVVRVFGTSPDGASHHSFTMTMEAATSTAGTTEDYFRHADAIRLGDQGELSYSAGALPLDDDGVECSQVYGAGPGEAETSVVLETCEHSFDSFSADGATLLAWGSITDGMETTIGMYDMASRELLWSRSATTGEMGRAAFAEWENDQRVLAPVYQGGEWQLVRFGRDGALERITDAVPGDELDPAFVPEVQRSTD